jgi:hypothetical protein
VAALLAFAFFVALADEASSCLSQPSLTIACALFLRLADAVQIIRDVLPEVIAS